MMAERKPSRVIRLELREPETTKVRYGRAVLRVHQEISITWGELARVLNARKAGQLTDEQVAWAFVREQVQSHSPTFDWDSADLSVLLPRVAAAVSDPVVSVRTPEELVPVLEKIKRDEEESWRSVNTQIARSVPKLNKTLIGSFGKLPNYTSVLPNVYQTKFMDFGVAKFPTQQIDFVTISENLAGVAQVKAVDFKKVTPVIGALDGIGKDWNVTGRTILGQMNTSKLGIDTSAFKQLLQYQSGAALTTGTVDGFSGGQWHSLITQAAQAARTVEADDLVETAETTETEAEKRISEVDLKMLLEAVSGLSDDLKTLSKEFKHYSDKQENEKRENTMARAVIASLLANLIFFLFQYVLALKLGIMLPPPQNPGK